MRKPHLLTGTFLIVILISSCLKDPVTPTVKSLCVHTIKSRSAIFQGSIDADGGAPVTEFGVCWNTNDNPTISDNKVIETGQHLFESEISLLSPGVTYYARAYAINKAGTSYGESITFTTTDFELTKSSGFPGQSRINPLSFTFNGKGYYGFGKSTGGTFLKDLWRFDPSTSSWTRLNDCPYNIDFTNFTFNTYSAKCLVESTLYIPQRNYFYAYNIISDTWSLTRQLETTLIYSSCFSVDGRAFLFRIFPADLYELVPETATLKKKNAVISNFGNAELNVVFVINNEAYMLNKDYENIDIYHYQLQSDTWEKKLEKKFSSIEFRSASFVTVFDNCAFIGQSTSFTNTGTLENPVINPDSPSSNIWKYDCVKNEFTLCANMPGELRDKSGSFSFTDKAYIIGGTSVDQNTRRFIPLDDTWIMSR